MDCPECTALESIRYECIKHYVDVMEARKSGDAQALPRLHEALTSAEFKLNQAWHRLEEHRRNHASIRASA